MNIKEELENYRKTIVKISNKKDEIEEIKENISEISGPSYDATGIMAKGFKQSSLEKAIINANEKIRKKQKEIKKLENKLAVVDSLILSLKEEERNIIVSFYLQGRTNRKIASELEVTLEAIKKRKKRIVKSMQTTYDKLRK